MNHWNTCIYKFFRLANCPICANFFNMFNIFYSFSCSVLLLFHFFHRQRTSLFSLLTFQHRLPNPLITRHYIHILFLFHADVWPKWRICSSGVLNPDGIFPKQVSLRAVLKTHAITSLKLVILYSSLFPICYSIF